ncbi:MAG: hypothetical protein ABI995_07935 [Acidobacteriota bacterium]
MSDRLYLSCWTKNYDKVSMLRRYQALLETFPFSKLSQRAQVLRVFAVSYSEPIALEKSLEPGTTVDDVISAARDFTDADCCVELEAAWDLWQYSDDWKLEPAAVTLSCLGPDFESGHDDHLRIDFGLDNKFLPMPEITGAIKMQESNLRSLLHLVADIDTALPLSRRHLWSESGANFAELLAKAVGKFDVH